MPMNALPTMLACLLAGAATGALYFGLLFLSVRLLIEQSGAREFVLLALTRGAVVFVALGLALTLDLEPAGLIAASAGFLIVRLALTQVTTAHLKRGEQCN